MLLSDSCLFEAPMLHIDLLSYFCELEPTPTPFRMNFVTKRSSGKLRVIAPPDGGKCLTLRKGKWSSICTAPPHEASLRHSGKARTVKG